jgi:hypothetical protein
MSWRQGVGKCEPSEQTLALMDEANAKARNSVIEECAKVAEAVQLRMHEECDFGAGIAAREIRALALTRPQLCTGSSALSVPDASTPFQRPRE